MDTRYSDPRDIAVGEWAKEICSGAKLQPAISARHRLYVRTYTFVRQSGAGDITFCRGDMPRAVHMRERARARKYRGGGLREVLRALGERERRAERGKGRGGV